MWGRVKDLLLLLSLALNAPFIVLWAAANTTHSQASARSATPPNETAPREPSGHGPPSVAIARVPAPRMPTWTRSEGTRSVYREVGVTDEQWHEIEPRLALFRADMFRLSRDMKRQRDELVELIAARELDDEAIRAKRDEILELHRITGDLITENMLADREVLTTEQQAKFFKKLRDYCGPSPAPKPSGRPPGTNHGTSFGSPRNRTK